MTSLTHFEAILHDVPAIGIGASPGRIRFWQDSTGDVAILAEEVAMQIGFYGLSELRDNLSGFDSLERQFVPSIDVEPVEIFRLHDIYQIVSRLGTSRAWAVFYALSHLTPAAAQEALKQAPSEAKAALRRLTQLSHQLIGLLEIPIEKQVDEPPVSDLTVENFAEEITEISRKYEKAMEYLRTVAGL